MSATALARGKTSTGPLLCRWSGCEAHENGAEFDSAEELARHVRTTHVEPFEVRAICIRSVYIRFSSAIDTLARTVSGCGRVSVGEVQGLQRAKLLYPMAEATCPTGAHEGTIRIYFSIYCTHTRAVYMAMHRTLSQCTRILCI